MDKLLILVDMDGVLADFEYRVWEQWQKLYPEHPVIELADRNQFYAHEQYGPKHYDRLRAITNSAGFFKNLPPINGAIAAMEQLQRYGHNVLICTAPLSANPYCFQEKYDWVVEHLGSDMANTMIVTKDKTMVKGDILIDDRPKIEGRYTPEWEHVLFDAPYNSLVVHQRRFKDWNEAIVELC